MTSAADANLIQSLNLISEELNRYLSPTIFIFGTIGNILNCLVLSQRILRSNLCAVIFLVSSFIDLISILIGLPTRILAGWNLDPTATINSVCKLRAFIVFSTRTIATWLITLATIDRWLLSCANIHRREMSTLKNVQRGIIITIILSLICYSHMLYCYQANVIDTPLQCYGKNQACRFTTDIIYGIISIVIPLILMIIFGLMTISNVHHVHNRVQRIDNETGTTHHTDHKQLHLKKTNHHLFRMLLVQIVFLILLYIPQAFEKFYITFKPFGSGSELDDAIKTFLYNIELLLAFIASGMPFYIYTLAGGSIFRKAFIDLIRPVIRKITCRFNLFNERH
jgi:hypothetical protein